jgi:hypothetical protein
MSWVDAIKKYAEQSKTKFAIPKRDSPEYAKIRAIQEEMAKGPVVVKKEKKRAVAVAVAPAPAPVPVGAEAPKKAKVAKKENQEVAVAAEPVPEVKVYKKSRVLPKPAEKPEVVEVVAEPVKEVKKPKAPKAPKRENVEPEPAPEPAPEVKRMTTVQEERAVKRAAKNARLEEQSKKAGEYALSQVRMTMRKEPVVIDFS